MNLVALKSFLCTYIFADFFTCGWAWVLLFAVSYLIGLLVLGLGTVLDWIYERFYRYFLPQKPGGIQEKATQIKQEHIKSGAAQYFHTYSWAKSFIQAIRPNMFVEPTFPTAFFKMGIYLNLRKDYPIFVDFRV